MSDSMWNQYGLLDKTRAILSEFIQSDPHTFGQPFVSVYQIAILFTERYPQDVQAINKQMSGVGEGVEVADSLPAYLAHQLSQNIKNGNITDIDAAWLSTHDINHINFSYQRRELKGTGNSTYKGYSLFRLVR